MSELKDALTDIKGVGPATADSILEVLEEHGGSEADTQTKSLIKNALDYIEEGNPDYARKYLERALES